MAPKFPPETYTPLEEQRLSELKTQLSDLQLSDELLDSANLIRWLRARSLDVAKANEMFRLSLEWRKANNIEGILEREPLPEDIRLMSPFGYAGLDREGYPIILMPIGRRDLREAMEKYGKEGCIRINTIFGEMMMDILQKESKIQGRQITQMIQIMDLEGFKYGQFTAKGCMDLMGQMQTCMNDNYPEICRYGMVVNAPKAFYILWNMFKVFIPKETQEKIDIFGTDKEKWKKALAKRLPLEGIPPHWGGTRSGEDEFCSKDEELWIQGPVPRSFFNHDKPYPDEDEESPNISISTVNPRDSLKVKLSVTAPNSSISWRFRTDNHDIGFQVLDPDGNELVTYRRVAFQRQFEEGQEKCNKLGLFTVIFDNSYSWARSKTVHYDVSVIIAEDAKTKIEEEVVNGKDVSYKDEPLHAP